MKDSQNWMDNVEKLLDILADQTLKTMEENVNMQKQISFLKKEIENIKNHFQI